MGGKPQASGAVYVLSNAAMEGYIKIGFVNEGTVDSVIERMRSLDRGSVPMPFNCEHASAVEDAPAVEKALHEAFGDSRVRSNREFFTVEPFRVVAILRLLELEDVTPPSGQVDTTEDGTIKQGSSGRGFPFADVSIPDGATLQWADDPTIECIVDGDKVVYEGRRLSISPLAQELKCWKTQPSGTPYWLYEGETLQERRRRLEQEKAGQD